MHEQAETASASPPVPPPQTSRGEGSVVLRIYEAFQEAHRADTLEQAVTDATAALRQRAEETKPPIRLKRLLQACNASLVKRPIATEGRLELGRSSFTVAVRPDRSWRRQRFTVAHEIGHILLLEAFRDSPERLRDLKAPGAWKGVERLCNALAAELLIPRVDFQSAVGRTSFRPDGIRALYDRYLVSYHTLFVRLKQVIPGASVTLWRQHARHRGEREALRVVKCYRSRYGPWLPVGLTARYLEPDVVTAAYKSGFAFRSELRLLFAVRDAWVAALGAAAPPARTASAEQLPIFDGFTVPDETHSGFDAVVLLMNPAHADTADLWKALARHNT